MGKKVWFRIKIENLKYKIAKQWAWGNDTEACVLADLLGLNDPTYEGPATNRTYKKDEYIAQAAWEIRQQILKDGYISQESKDRLENSYPIQAPEIIRHT